MKDPYQVLNVAKGAHPDDIKKAYRQLARQYHPDARPDDKTAENRFKDIAAAYDVLSNPDRRKRFDAGETGMDRATQHTQKKRPPNRPPHKAPGHNGAKSRFDSFFKNRAQKERAGIKTKGADVTYTLDITLTDAALGAQKTVRMAGGKTLKVKIPPATETGHVLRLKGQGMAGLGGGLNGDALVEIAVTAAANETFTRHGLDIESTEAVPMETAVLGGTVNVETVGGAVSLNVPKGANSGTQLRLKGRGVHHPDGRRGDHIVTVQVRLPENQDNAFRDFVRKWSAAMLRTKEKATP